MNLDKNVEYLEIADDILKYSFENDNLESEEKNLNLNLKIKNNIEEKNIKDKENLILDKIYKNFNLTSDILFHSLIGIFNLKVNCFFNTGLQIILHSYNFILDIIYDIDNKTDNYSANSISIAFIEFIKLIIKTFIEKNEIKSIDNIFDRIITNEIHKKEKNIAISPKELLKVFTDKHPMYKNSQEDCVEFIRVFLNDLSAKNNKNISPQTYKELSYSGKSKSEASKEFHINYIRKENSAVIENFYFQIMNTYVCSCGYQTFAFDKYLDLPLLIPDEKKNYKLIDLIKYRLKSKIIEWHPTCENCKLPGLNHQKFETFDMISNYIIIYLQRINKFLKTKNLSFIEFEESLNLAEFCDKKINPDDCLYKLLGIIYHEGTLDFGHYYTIIKINEQWFKFIDNNISLITNIEFKSKDVCAFLFQK